MGAGEFTSASYDQTDELLKKNISPEEGRLDDHALLARTCNPWNQERKLIIIAGIRGIGTWGAARYLRNHTNELVRRSKGGDFACVVTVTYENYKIVALKQRDHFARLSG